MISSRVISINYLVSAVLLITIYQQELSLVCQTANVIGSVTIGRRIEIKPSVPTVFFEAQTISNKVLTCRALGDQPGLFNQLRWSGPNRMDNWDELSKRHRVREITRNGYSVELEFQRPSPDDSGTYYCQGTYQSSEYHNASIVVKVYNPIKLENCPERQFVVENATGQKITCRITGESASLVLSKDGNVIEGSNQRYKWDNDDGLEILGQANRTDAGVYAIEVTTDLTGDRRVQYITVEVHSKPEILPPNITAGSIAEFSGVEGEPTELRCQVTGNPQPLVYWYDPRLRNLTSVGGYFVNPERGTLLISKVNRVDDNGNFMCVAHNHVGEAKRTVSMAALQRPTIIAFENKTVEEGSEAYLDCRSTGVPKPIFSIRKHGSNQVPYRVGDGLVTDILESEEGGGAQVYVYRVKIRTNRSQFGLHYCNATNSAGSSERVGQLNVKHKPDLSLTMTEQYVRLGKNITVTCHIKAYPQPTVNWYNEFDQQIINAQVNFKASPDGQTHYVTMMPPASLQASTGRYKCRASNDMGEDHIIITTRFTTQPGIVNAVTLETTPTTAKLQLTVSSDGGDKIRAYKYKAEGVTNDRFNPFVNYPGDMQNETSIDAVHPVTTYIVRNLLPNYTYRIFIRAVNEVGDGDPTELTIYTPKPSAPSPPVIIKPALPSAQVGYTSDFQNGYVLNWSPPDLDNGDPITKYIIRINRVKPESPNEVLDDGEQRIIEQPTERPLHARLGPFEPNQYYLIQLQARNKYGDSESAKIIIYTNIERPVMPDFGPQALAWLIEPSTSLLIALLILGIVSLLIIDIIFCSCFQIGVTHSVRNCFCPAKANSVISNKTYT